jgi:hypothetical protein
MIISASRRTDIPAFFSDWFFERLRQGYVEVKNPFNAKQIRRISLRRTDVDCMVFWTKNPEPMLKQLDRLSGFAYYFLFTLTGYGKDVEPGIPSKDEDLISSFLNLADRIGPERVIWRYDPIFLSEKYTLERHREHFEKIARALKGYTEKCVISFMDFYRNTQKRMSEVAPGQWREETMRQAAEQLAIIAMSYGIGMETCAEEIDLSGVGVGHASCVDAALIERITGKNPNAEKDRYQRPGCGCAASVDIGAYNTCPGGCKYCYANYNLGQVAKNIKSYDPMSSILCG